MIFKNKEMKEMDIVHNPHDKFFKTSLSDLKVARSFFETHLPNSIQQYLDFNSLELQPGNYIDEVLVVSGENKSKIDLKFHDPLRPELLSILDPLDPGNNILY